MVSTAAITSNGRKFKKFDYQCVNLIQFKGEGNVIQNAPTNNEETLAKRLRSSDIGKYKGFV